jgi:acetylornithine deacetylase/succinyl-diaminopimelate desuccinylase-like protein
MSLETRNTPVPITDPTVSETPSQVPSLRSSSVIAAQSKRSTLPGLHAEIAGLDPVSLAAELVRIPSHPGVERQEEAVAERLHRWLAAHGVSSQCIEVEPGRPNLIATVRAPRPGKHLVLCGHTDTVAVNEGDDPRRALAGEIAAGRLAGRGAIDMKGALAAMAAALAALARTGALTAGAVTFAAVIDEEMEGRGAIDFARGLEADGAIVGEPTQNRLALGHKGLEWIVFEFHGRAAHGGRPERGANAIAAAARFIAAAEDALRAVAEARRHPLLGVPTLNFGTIQGGDQPSTVPERCVVTADRRLVPGETWASVSAELAAIARAIAAERPGITIAQRRYFADFPVDPLPIAIEPAHPLARAVREARISAGEPDSPDESFPAWTDAGFLHAIAGVPCVVLGPGDLALAHSPHEAVETAAIVRAAEIYARAAVAFCGGGL